VTDPYEVAGSLRLALYTICEYFVASLPTGVKAVNSGGMPGAASKEAPLPVPAGILDIRSEAHKDLHFWAGFIMGTVKDVNGNPLRVYVDAAKPVDLARFIIVWAEQLARLEPDDAANCANDMAGHAGKLKGAALPTPIKGMFIGKCPVLVDVDRCGGEIRLPADKGNLTCPQCGMVETIGWWQSQILDTVAPPLVTAADLISIVALATERVITHDQVWQWATRGKIERAGKDIKGRTLYDHQAVVAFVKATTGQKEGVA